VEIQINNQNLDFTIESNETLGQVVHDIESWLRGTDLVLYSVKHGDQELLARPYEEWSSTPHSEVGTLELKVKHTRELTLLNLRTVLEYLEMLKRAVESGDADRLGELAPGFSALAESLHKHFPDPDAALQAMIALFAEQQNNAWTEEKSRQAVGLIDLVSTKVRFRIQEIEDPKAALKVLSGALKHCIEEISEISLLLQTGKDRQAMDTMVRFSELSQTLIRLVASVFPEGGRPEGNLEVGGISLQEFYRQLNTVLSELLQAFEARDSVLIGDLMEYEIAPRLEQMRAFLQELV
jgi:hypothetical protein